MLKELIMILLQRNQDFHSSSYYTLFMSVVLYKFQHKNLLCGLGRVHVCPSAVIRPEWFGLQSHSYQTRLAGSVGKCAVIEKPLASAIGPGREAVSFMN